MPLRPISVGVLAVVAVASAGVAVAYGSVPAHGPAVSVPVLAAFAVPLAQPAAELLVAVDPPAAVLAASAAALVEPVVLAVAAASVDFALICYPTLVSLASTRLVEYPTRL